MLVEKILIVGGTGFIGRNLALKALDKGYLVTVLSLNKPSENFKIKNVEYIQCNLIHFERLQKKLTKRTFHYVINLGGYVDHSNFLNGGFDVVNTHLIGVLNIIKVLDWNCLKQFIQIGSSDEYGKNTAPQNENIMGDVISPYSFSKLSITNLLKMLHEYEKFPMVVLRLFLVYGPGQNIERFIPQVIHGCLSGNQFPVSMGEQQRDFCYIDDITSGIILSLNNEKAIGEVINLGSGNPISVKNIIQKIMTLVGSGNPIFGEIEYRVDENMKLYADVNKAKKILNWYPQVSLEEGLKNTILHLKDTG